MSDILTLFTINPELIAIIFLGIMAGTELVIIVKAGNILRSYSKMLVMKGRIKEDGTVTLDDKDIIPFVNETISLMDDLESLLHYITGYILNHPSTGWFKAYVPTVEAIGESVVQQLAQESTPDLPVQSVNPEGAA